MDTASVGLGRESYHSEVTGLRRDHEVMPPGPAPAREIFGRDQNPAIVSGAAARAALQAVEVIIAGGHRRH